MEAILNIYASGKVANKDHVRRARCADGLWGKYHKSSHRK